VDQKTSLSQSPTRSASILSVELIGYASAPAARQHAVKQALRSLLQHSTELIPATARQVRDTDNGALVAFLTTPQHAAYVALALLRAVRKDTSGGAIGIEQLRLGLHFGAVLETAGIESRTNYAGDGVRKARQMMEVAQPGAALASRAFFDALADLDHNSNDLFNSSGTVNMADGRELDFHTLDPETPAFEQFKKSLSSMAAETPTDDANGIGSSLKQAGDFVKTWFISINTVILLGTFSLSLIGKFTNQVRAIETIATTLIGLAVVIGLFKLLARIPAAKSGMSQYPKLLRSVTNWHVFSLTLVPGAMLAITAILISPKSIPSHEPTLSEATSDKAIPAQPTPTVAPVTPMVAPIATTTKIHPQVVKANAPPTNLSVPHKNDKDVRERAVVPTQPVRMTPDGPGEKAGAFLVVPAKPVRTTSLPPVKVVATRPPRCALILQKAAVGELISPVDREFLTSLCQ